MKKLKLFNKKTKEPFSPIVEMESVIAPDGTALPEVIDKNNQKYYTKQEVQKQVNELKKGIEEAKKKRINFDYYSVSYDQISKALEQGLEVTLLYDGWHLVYAGGYSYSSSSSHYFIAKTSNIEIIWCEIRPNYKIARYCYALTSTQYDEAANLGSRSDLTTTAKNTFVAAINEINANKANDKDVVHKTGDERIKGVKHFEGEAQFDLRIIVPQIALNTLDGDEILLTPEWDEDKSLNTIRFWGDSEKGVVLAGLRDPIESSDAANKGYVDGKMTEIDSKIGDIITLINNL